MELSSLEDPTEADEDPRFELRRTAFHEAAHIVAAWALRAVRLFSASIVPADGFNGEAVYGFQGGRGASVNSIIVNLAGPAGSRRFERRCRFDGGGSEEEPGSDRHQVARDLAALCRSPEVASIVHRHCEAEAARLVAENWDAIEAVAAELLKHEVLNGDDLNRILADVAVDRANAAEPARRLRWAAIIAKAAHPSPTPMRST